MAEKRSSVKNGLQSVVTQLSKRPSSSSQAQRSTRVKESPGVKPASAPTHRHTNDLWAKEKKYKLRNAEIEAKTAALVKQADKIMRQQSDILSKPLSTLQLTDSEDEEANRMIKPQQFTVQQPDVKVVTRKAVQSQNMRRGKECLNKTLTLEVCAADGLPTVKDSADDFLTDTIRRLEENMDDPCETVVDDVENAADCEEADVSVPVLKANLRIMQEELDELSFDCLKKDDEHVKLIAKMKAVEEARSGLQRTVRGQQAQIEKHQAAAEESARKCDALQLQVSRLRKEIDGLNRSHKQAAALQSTAEVRLTRAQEEVERLKTQLSKANQMNKDKIKEEQQTQENLLAENKLLKKQKTELIVGFKKQLKLIDVLKRQKMHFEAAKLLSFTEDEFMKALDWGNSHPA